MFDQSSDWRRVESRWSHTSLERGHGLACCVGTCERGTRIKERETISRTINTQRTKGTNRQPDKNKADHRTQYESQSRMMSIFGSLLARTTVTRNLPTALLTSTAACLAQHITIRAQRKPSTPPTKAKHLPTFHPLFPTPHSTTCEVSYNSKMLGRFFGAGFKLAARTSPIRRACGGHSGQEWC